MRLELTQRSVYALRAILCLAGNPGEGVLSSARIARSNGIPVRFLPQVMGDLARAGLVEARVGRKGGYRLARSTSQVSLLDVIAATRSEETGHVCVMHDGHAGADTAERAVHLVVVAAQAALNRQLARTSLRDVCEADRHSMCAEGSADAATPAGAGDDRSD